MAISKLQPVSTASTPSAFSVTVAAANNPQKVVKNVDSGVYTITVSPTSSTAIVSFVSGTSFIGTTTTSSGSIVYNLATPATTVYIQSNNANDVVTINLTASAPVNTALSGTLDTITTSGTYTQTGLLWVLAIGGGGGGSGFGTINANQMGCGGGAGGLAMFYGNVTGSTTVTIGSAGTGGALNNAGTSGGTTSFGSYAVATGGGGAGLNSIYPGIGGTGTTGTATAGGGNGGNQTGSNPGIVVPNIWTGIKNGTHGGGGGGGNGNTGGPGQGAGDGGIGRGGNGGANGSVGAAATGYGSGGGGGGQDNVGGNRTAGGNGSPGVVYVLRGF